MSNAERTSIAKHIFTTVHRQLQQPYLSICHTSLKMHVDSACNFCVLNYLDVYYLLAHKIKENMKFLSN